MKFVVKSAIALATAAVVWWIANAVGGEPRPLDFYILFSAEYAGVSIFFMKKGWD